MTMIKCPECRHHISSMAKSCPECGCPIDPAWAEAEAKKELERLEEVPFTVVSEGEEVEQPETPDEDERPEPTREQEPPAQREEQPAKRSSGGGWIIAAVVFLGLLIGGLYYYDYRANQQREERAYEMLQGCSNPAFFEDFMIRFPKSKYIDDVRARYKEVAARQDEWQKLIQNGSSEELRQFIALHPTSPYVKMAQLRRDSLDWTAAKEERTLESVTHYMASHPDGDYIDKAESLRQTLEREKAEKAAAAAAARRDSLARLDSTFVAL
ncbi:MAG: hypothetical protein IJ197_07460 [Bacteroidaceae bacterium]|nr:hypothetical protein [Bacteroidaceae bacterium]